jgi:hypothetical protein
MLLHTGGAGGRPGPGSIRTQAGNTRCLNIVMQAYCIQCLKLHAVECHAAPCWMMELQWGPLRCPQHTCNSY